MDNASLRAFIAEHLGHGIDTWPPKSWTPAELTLAAIYYNPDLAVARSAVALAQAGVTSAGVRPNPSLAISPGGATDAPSPWVLSIVPTIPIETAGKRGYRIKAAQRLTDVALLQLAETAWQVRTRLRAALLDFLLGKASLESLRSEEQLRTEVVRLIEQQFAFGLIPRPEVDTAQIDLATVRLAIRTAETQLVLTRAALASAIGVPVTALETVQLNWPDFEHPPAAASFPDKDIQRTAVLNRLDILRSLAQYAVSEAALQSEISKQYPDVDLGPGYNFDAGTSKYTFGITVTLPLFNRNQGPIAEAAARRKQAEERFLALQAQAIGESEKALGAYKSAFAEADAAAAALEMQQKKERLIHRSFDLGTADKLTLTGMQVQTVVAVRGRLMALAHVQSALGALENAVQKPLESDWVVPSLPSSDHPQADIVKEQPK